MFTQKCCGHIFSFLKKNAHFGEIAANESLFHSTVDGQWDDEELVTMTHVAERFHEQRCFRSILRPVHPVGNLVQESDDDDQGEYGTAGVYPHQHVHL